jgi:hypothetical protein
MKTPTPAPVVVSFDGVKMKDFFAYWDAVRRANWMQQHVFFARVVKQWIYPFDPTNPASFEELGLEEYALVQRAIKSAADTVVANLTVVLNASQPHP